MAEVGVIETDNPVTSVYAPALVEVVKLSVLTVETTCNTLPPPAGAAHFNPVASAESATILTLGIVPGTIANDSA